MAAQDSNEELQKQLNSLREDFSSLTRTMKDMSASYSAQGQQKVRHAADQAQQHMKDSFSKVQGEVQTHPISSVAMAFGIGLVIGKILDR